MILLDRENWKAPGWSHVLSSEDSIEELERFRQKVGAPPSALQVKGVRYPHLDIKQGPRRRALSDRSVRIFPSTKELMRYYFELKKESEDG